MDFILVWQIMYFQNIGATGLCRLVLPELCMSPSEYTRILHPLQFQRGSLESLTLCLEVIVVWLWERLGWITRHVVVVTRATNQRHAEGGCLNVRNGLSGYPAASFQKKIAHDPPLSGQR